MRHNDIQAWEAFVTTVRTAGLSQAARSLGSTLSNHVRLLKELELSLVVHGKELLLQHLQLGKA